MISHKQIETDTIKYGGQWGYTHTRRLLKLIELIREDNDYDTEAVWMAAHLHDWGGYPQFIEKGKDHAVRSKEVAAGYLSQTDLSETRRALILECIELHHTISVNKSYEAILLSDADALDFLGSIGLFRIFSKQTKNLRAAYEKAENKITSCRNILQFKKSKEIAEDRIIRMKEILLQFEEDSFGMF